MEYESKHEAQERKDMVAKRRMEAQNQLNWEKAFISELANKYDYIRMSREIKENVKARLGKDLASYEPRSYVNNLCLQVETLYIFSILKSLLFSQFFDPNIQKIVSRYSITELPKKEIPYYALKSYEMKKSPVEKMLSKEDACMILKKYSLLGRQCYINVIYEIKRYNKIVMLEPLFQHPITYDLVYPIISTDPEYKGVSFEELQKRNEFPTELFEYVSLWHSVWKSFKKLTIESKWCGGIAKVIEDLVFKEFDSKPASNPSRTRLNPFIIKLMEMWRLRMETCLAEK